MAIKINGTTVIDDSRNLTNINNLSFPKSNSAVIASSTTWTVPAGVSEIAVLAVGGGPGGGSQTWFGLHQNSGMAALFNYGVTPGNTLGITIGAGGTNNRGDGGTTTVTDNSTATVILSQTGGTGGSESTGGDVGSATGSGTASTNLSTSSTYWRYFAGSNGVSGSYNAANSVNWFKNSVYPGLLLHQAGTGYSIDNGLMETLVGTYFNAKAAIRPVGGTTPLAWSTGSAYQPGSQGAKGTVNTSDTAENAAAGVGGAVFIYY